MTTTTGPGPLDHSRVDDEDVRADRRRRLFAAMADHDLDVLVLGRPAEVAFATGARQLWTAGSRPFGPACVAVRATGRTHLLSVSDYDVPARGGPRRPVRPVLEPGQPSPPSLAAIPGLREAARGSGTTSSSPGFGRLLAAVAPGGRGRSTAAPRCGRPACPRAPPRWPASPPPSRMAEAGPGRAWPTALRPGRDRARPGRRLPGGHRRPAARRRRRPRASPAPRRAAARWRCGGSPPTRRSRPASSSCSTRAAFYRGYEGGIGRTRVAGGATPAGRERPVDALDARCRAALDAVVAACRPGRHRRGPGRGLGGVRRGAPRRAAGPRGRAGRRAAGRRRGRRGGQRAGAAHGPRRHRLGGRGGGRRRPASATWCSSPTRARGSWPTACRAPTARGGHLTMAERPTVDFDHHDRGLARGPGRALGASCAGARSPSTSATAGSGW